METVGIRELKNRLSKYVRQVEAGDIVIVTDRGRVVAELVPPGHAGRRNDLPAGLLELERRGLVRLGTGRNGPDSYPTLAPLRSGAPTVQELIDWDRRDR